ncbi:hypothetical protein BC834DRAFT_973162 [Gloeopeniophorella convolvens]|nr:hypothetical protein BC834DRAFT_973162 [Gloeopeniophorella convolvens]
MYLEKAEKDDDKMTESWKETPTVSLYRLFSATVATFIYTGTTALFDEDLFLSVLLQSVEA